MAVISVRQTKQPGAWSGELGFELPSELIAQRPTARREDARLMVVDRAAGRIAHRYVRDLPDLVSPGDLIVANDSRVYRARLHARKRTGGRVELLLLAPDGAGPVAALSGSSKPLRAGDILVVADEVSCTVTEAAGAGRCLLDFGPIAVAEVIERHGRVPLPPYIDRREADDEDLRRYQTVFAGPAGSVAAPTAGLHLGSEILARIQEKSAFFRKVTLHVGPGTFIPIRSDPDSHRMESEWFSIDPALSAELARARIGGDRVVAVGTTTVRALETAALATGAVEARRGWTDLFIRPGHRFQAIDALMTNFHLPHSTLLCLVMAFAGEELLREAYRTAVRERYRFYSYGDAMLVV